MAYDSTSAFLSKQVYASLNSRRLRGATDIQNLGANGVASVQQVTTLESDSVEQITGITDPGQISMTFIADPSTAEYDLLVQEQKDSLESEFRVVYGTGPAGKVTDGSAWITGTATIGTGGDEITYTDPSISIPNGRLAALPPIRAGHYVKWGSGDPASGNSSRITAISGGDGTNPLVLTVGTGVTLPSGATSTISFVRPAFEFRRNCRILELSHSPAVDTPFGMQLTLLPTGNGTVTKGSPTLTI